MSAQRLFVYGTLQPGRANAHLLERIGGTWTQASVKGHLHEKGWGATMGYPAIKIDPEGETVKGYVFESPRLAENWLALDEFEGDAYKRVETTVTLVTGIHVSAFIYQLSAAAH